MLTLLFFLFFQNFDQGDKTIPREIPASVKDFEFRKIEINWIADTHMVHQYREVLTEEESRLIRKLGCPSWECREDASKALREKYFGATDALVWGSRSKDPEVALRSRNLIERLYRCIHCNGTGVCPACRGFGFCQEEGCGNGGCVVCTGTGDYRKVIVLDQDSFQSKVVDRDIFEETEPHVVQQNFDEVRP